MCWGSWLVLAKKTLKADMLQAVLVLTILSYKFPVWGADSLTQVIQFKPPPNFYLLIIHALACFDLSSYTVLSRLISIIASVSLVSVIHSLPPWSIVGTTFLSNHEDIISLSNGRLHWNLSFFVPGGTITAMWTKLALVIGISCSTAKALARREALAS